MTAKRFTLKTYDGITCDVFDKDTEIANVHRDDAKELVSLLNALHEENLRLKDQYERKDRQLKRAKKDTRKYTDYFMNELGWDCDRIIREVFK